MQALHFKMQFLQGRPIFIWATVQPIGDDDNIGTLGHNTARPVTVKPL